MSNPYATFGPQRCTKCGKTHYVGDCPPPVTPTPMGSITIKRAEPRKLLEVVDNSKGPVMTDVKLKPENVALVLRVTGNTMTGSDAEWSNLERLLDAARDEGRRAVVGGDWVLVPRVPNEAMDLAGAALWLGGGTVHGMSDEWRSRMSATWSAMLAAAPSPPVADTRAEIIWIDIGIKCPGCGCAIQTGEDWIDMGGGTWSPGDIRSVQGCANGCDIRVEIPDMKIKVADGPA